MIMTTITYPGFFGVISPYPMVSIVVHEK